MNQCELCGAYLDAMEKCDCLDLDPLHEMKMNARKKLNRINLMHGTNHEAGGAYYNSLLREEIEMADFIKECERKMKND